MAAHNCHSVAKEVVLLQFAKKAPSYPKKIGGLTKISSRGTILLSSILTLATEVFIMHDLSPRQVEILKHIIKEYIDSADPVGSETLEKKYDLGVSPATIRNEMAEMERLEYLAKSHTSSGRVPTSKALKFYVDELMKEKTMSVAEEVEAKEKVWDLRHTPYPFLRQVTKHLAQKTGTLAVATTDTGDIFYAGYSNILEMPEFYDIDITRNLLRILDEITYFDQVLQRLEQNCDICFGDELGPEMFKPYSFVFSRYHTNGDHSGSIGIIGPQRLHYDLIVPLVRYYGGLIDEVGNW